MKVENIERIKNMKKIIILFCLVMYSCVSGLFSSTFTIEVPQKLLDQNSSLMVYMIDQTGHQRVGKCQLDSNSKERKILQQELEMTTVQEAENFATVLNLMDKPALLDQDIVIVHFEFDYAVRVLKILVVKNSFLEENLFDVLTLSIAENSEFEHNHHHTFEEFEDDLDVLSALVSNIDTKAMAESIQQEQKKASRLDQYMLYAEIYMLMQYGRMKRAIQNMTSWFSHETFLRK
jgi:hypothetical protein